MSPRREPVSRRDRPAKAPLSRAGVVSVALEIMRSEGLEKLTMRRLAAALDTGPASLYVYVRNVAELHAAVLDELLDGLAFPEPSADRWHADLVELMGAYSMLLLGYPSLARSVLALRPSGSNYLRLIDVLLGLLKAGGVESGPAAWGVDVLLQHGTAMAAEQGTRGESAEAAGEQELLVDALQEADPGAYPNIAGSRDVLLAGTGPQRMAWQFDVLIAGIRATPTPA